MGFKIKKDVARWSKDDVQVDIEKKKMVDFVLTRALGESHHLEFYSVMGAEALVDTFIAALQA